MQIVILTVVAILVLLFLGIWLISGTLVTPFPVEVGELPADLPGEIVRLQSPSGGTIIGWHLRSDQERGVIVLAHPYRGSRLAMLNRTRLLYAAGYSVILFDLQAHGESLGDRITIGYLEQHDVATAVEYARQHHPHQPLGIVGFSMGGAATLMAQIPNVDALVLEAVYPTIRAAIHNRVRVKLGALAWLPAELLVLQLKPRMGINARDLRPIDHLPQVGCPVFILSGTDDPHTTSEDTAAMFAAATEPKQLWMVDGALHEDLYDFTPDEYEPRLLEFFDQHLRRQRTAADTTGAHVGDSIG